MLNSRLSHGYSSFQFIQTFNFRFCDGNSRSGRPQFPPHSFQTNMNAMSQASNPLSHTPSVTSSSSPSPSASSPSKSPQMSPLPHSYIANMYNRQPPSFPIYPPAAAMPGQSRSYTNRDSFVDDLENKANVCLCQHT